MFTQSSLLRSFVRGHMECAIDRASECINCCAMTNCEHWKCILISLEFQWKKEENLSRRRRKLNETEKISLIPSKTILSDDDDRCQSKWWQQRLHPFHSFVAYETIRTRTPNSCSETCPSRDEISNEWNSSAAIKFNFFIFDPVDVLWHFWRPPGLTPHCVYIHVRLPYLLISINVNHYHTHTPVVHGVVNGYFLLVFGADKNKRTTKMEKKSLHNLHCDVDWVSERYTCNVSVEDHNSIYTHTLIERFFMEKRCSKWPVEGKRVHWNLYFYSLFFFQLLLLTVVEFLFLFFPFFDSHNNKWLLINADK